MNVETSITNGIKVSVETLYQPDHSNPAESKFMFAYQVSIENLSSDTVQLVRRHWYIMDSGHEMQEVEGEGVIGQMPILSPGESHQYVSWSQLFTEVGKMYGYYSFVRETDGEIFKVKIPEFQLVTPSKMN